MSGKLFGVGVGIGEGELLTLKAKNIIETSDIIILPNKNKENCIAYKIIENEISNLNLEKLFFCDFPMTKNNEELQIAQNNCILKIEHFLNENKNVSFITIGDPTIYSTFMYIHEALNEKGFNVEIINGIPSFCAVAAKLGIPLGLSDEQIHIIPANYNLSDPFKLDGTLIFMKSGKKIKELKSFLVSKLDEYDFDFYSVSNCGFENEFICNKIEELNENSDYLTVVIIKNIKSKNIKNYKFFQNTKCEMFPCHKIEHEENFNCLFCYCPLYSLGDKCGGNFKFTEKGIKSCIDCFIPHHKENYDLMIKKIKNGQSKK